MEVGGAESKCFLGVPFINIKGNKNRRLISEGVASYFQHKTNEYSNIGYKLVKPILDKDFDKGIELLLKNPPEKEDLKDLIKYREKILGKMTPHKWF